MMRKSATAVSSLFAFVAMLLTGCEKDGGGGSTVRASDYGVTDPNQSVFIVQNQTSDRAMRSVTLTPDGGDTMSLPDVGPGAQTVRPISPGTYSVNYWSWYSSGSVRLGTHYGSPKFSVGAGQGAILRLSKTGANAYKEEVID